MHRWLAALVLSTAAQNCHRRGSVSKLKNCRFGSSVHHEIEMMKNEERGGAVPPSSGKFQARANLVFATTKLGASANSKSQRTWILS
jgi:hypothetical protein